MIKKFPKTLFLYIYHKEEPDFWTKILEEKKKYSNIFIFNLTSEKIELSDKTIKIINSENNFTEINNFIYSQRLKFDYLILLEQNEIIDLNIEIEKFLIKFREYPAINLAIEPLKSEVYEFDIEPFITKEARVFILKHKNLKEFLDKKSFYFNSSFNSFSNSEIRIIKENVDSDFDILKAEILDDSYEKNFFLALANFYKDSNLSEELFTKIVENQEETTYLKEAFTLLIKLLYRKMDFDKIFTLKSKHPKYFEDYKLSNLYLAFTFYKLENYLSSIKNIRAFKNISDTNFPFIYNYSDINVKANLIIAKILYLNDNLACANKFLELAENNCKNTSNEILLIKAKINFKKNNFEACYEILSNILNSDFIPTYFVKEVKTVFLNLLLFIPFKEDYLEILKKDIFAKKDEIIRVADTFYMNEDFVEALSLYLLSVEKFGSENSLLFKLGYICSRLKILNQAIYYYEKFLEKEPEHLDALNNLAFIYMNNDNLDLAQKTYEKLLKLNNFSFEANLYLALINISLRQKKKAEKYLEQAKTINPVSQEVLKLSLIIKSEL
ncbi:MAG: tetratricopeptide repeat protein [Candidatus Sericytochromatia bacterium]